MKSKILVLLSLFISSIFIISNVSAAENKLYFTNDGNRLNYDSALYDNIFIKHLDMLPGKVYKDTITIENGTNKPYPLYLKIKDEQRSALIKELLENIVMEIYIEDSLVYSGYASGVDYEYNDKLIKDAVYLGMYEGGAKKTLTVITNMRASYENKNNNALATVDWDFYTMYDDSIDTINPNTKNNLNDRLFLVFIGSAVVLIVTMTLKYFNNKKALS